jgi:hypothetical protein
LIGCSKGTKVDATSCGIYLEDTYSISRPVWCTASLSDDASPTISIQNLNATVPFHWETTSVG